MAGTDHLTANFDANNVGGRVEGGYRFAVPDVFGWPGFGVTPYAALQVQAFHTPSYSEMVASGASTFALDLRRAHDNHDAGRARHLAGQDLRPRSGQRGLAVRPRRLGA